MLFNRSLRYSVSSWVCCNNFCHTGNLSISIIFHYFEVVVFQSLSHAWLFATPWTIACHAPLSSSISRSLLKLMSIELVILTISSAAPFSFCLQSFPASGSFPISQFFPFRWPKYWSFSFSSRPSNDYSGLISFKIDWVRSPCCPRDSQESSPIQQFKSISSSALSLLYSPTLTSETTAKTIALTVLTFVK